MNLFITLDYELFMGVPGTSLKSLVEPMSKLTKVADKYGVKFVVFVDAAYLYRLHQLKSTCSDLLSEYELVSTNVRELEDDGHDIELHFHPQWLYSDYDNINHKWIMDYEHYKMSDMDRCVLEKTFAEAKALLDGIIGRNTIAFRAGGYSLNSLDGYASFLRSNGILIDSSVCGRISKNSPFQLYDYSNIPQNKSMWRFDDDVCKESSDGFLIELPISHTSKFYGFDYIMKKRQLTKKFGYSEMFGDGKGSDSVLPKICRLKQLVTKFFSGLGFMASIDGIISCNLYSLYNTLKNNGVENMVLIGHPKCQSERSIEIFDDFLKNIDKEDRILTFRQVSML